MSYLLHFTGPSFEQTVALLPGAPPVVVGRDPGAAVYLPDTKRLVSRRHVSIEWFPEGARVLVLSSNGISTDLGDYFEGDTVLLADGQSGRIGPYTLLVGMAPVAADADATRFSGMGTRPIPTGPVTRSAQVEDLPPPSGDALADLAAQWSQPMRTFPGSEAYATSATTPAATAASPERQALLALSRGLGIAPPDSTPFAWEAFGRRVRDAVECLGEHLAARAQARQDLQAEDGTRLGGGPVNPLKNGLPAADLLQYLLLQPDGTRSLMPPHEALREAAGDARTHETAARLAAQAMAEGAIREFDPARLRGTLLKGKLSMTAVVDNARLWDLYTAWHAKNGEQPVQWTTHLFNRYYLAAYLRETERLRRAAQPDPPARH